MAIMSAVNKAVKAALPDIDVRAVRGDGYVYFEGADGFDEIPSLYVNPVATSTETMTRLVLEDIKSAIADREKKISVELAGVPAQLPPGLHSAKVGAVMVSSGGSVTLVADISCARPVESYSLVHGAQVVGRADSVSLADEAERMFYKDQAEWGPSS